MFSEFNYFLDKSNQRSVKFVLKIGFRVYFCTELRAGDNQCPQKIAAENLPSIITLLLTSMILSIHRIPGAWRWTTKTVSFLRSNEYSRRSDKGTFRKWPKACQQIIFSLNYSTLLKTFLKNKTLFKYCSSDRRSHFLILLSTLSICHSAYQRISVFATRDNIADYVMAKLLQRQ